MTLKVCMLVLSTVAPDIRVEKEAESLVKAGYKVRIIGITTYKEPLRFKLSRPPLKETRFTKHGSYVIDRIPIKRGSVLKYFEYWKKIKTLFKKKNDWYDVIHYHDLNVLPLISSLKKYAKQHIYDSHELFPEMMALKYGKLGLKAYNWLEEKHIYKANYVIIPSDGCAYWMATKYGSLKFQIVENLPHINEINPLETEQYDKITFVIWGNMYYHRGYEETVDAIASISGTISSDRIQVIIIGDGENEQTLKQRVKDKGIEDYFVFKGWTNPTEAFVIMRKSHYGVCLIQSNNAHLEYASPNRLYDYLACGLPFIASTIDGIYSIFKDKEYALLTKPDNWVLLLQTFAQACFAGENKAHHEELRKQVYADHLKEFNWKKSEERLLQVYKEIDESLYVHFE